MREAGASWQAIADELEREGVEAFAASYRELLASLDERARGRLAA